MPKVGESLPYRLYNEDCFETFKRIADGSVDMVLCDLPYGTTACKWDAVIPFDPLWREYRRVCKPNAAIVLTASQPFTSALLMSNVRAFKYSWIWEKSKCGNFQLVNVQPMKIHEDVLVFSFGQPPYTAQGTKPCRIVLSNRKKGGSLKHMASEGKRDEYVQTTTNYPKSILQFSGESGHHPTQKPLGLMSYFVKTYTVEGDTVLDNCMGSGTTGVACAHSGRKFIGCDSDTEHGYFEIAETRIKVAYQQAASKSRKS